MKREKHENEKCYFFLLALFDENVDERSALIRTSAGLFMLWWSSIRCLFGGNAFNVFHLVEKKNENEKGGNVVVSPNYLHKDESFRLH